MKIVYLHLRLPGAPHEGAGQELLRRDWYVYQSPAWYVSAFCSTLTDEHILAMTQNDLRASGIAPEDHETVCLILDADEVLHTTPD